MGCRTPFTPPGDYYQTQPFHTGPIACCPSPHLALDIVGRDGQTAHAINAGKVWQASWDGGGWAVGGGYSVIVLHGPDARPTMKTSYCHGKGLYVKPGQRIYAGNRLISCDNKGNSTGSHLHHTVELWSKDRWVPVDPHSVFPAHSWKNGSQAAGSRYADSRARTSVRVNGTYVNLRADATTNSKVLASLKLNTMTIFNGVKKGQIPAGFTSPNWYRVFWYNGSMWLSGYLHAELARQT